MASRVISSTRIKTLALLTSGRPIRDSDWEPHARMLSDSHCGGDGKGERVKRNGVS